MSMFLHMANYIVENATLTFRRIKNGIFKWNSYEYK